MKITRVEAIHLRLPEINERCDGSQETLDRQGPHRCRHRRRRRGRLVFVRGQGDHRRADLAQDRRGLAECVLGQDPFEIDRLVHRMYEGAIFYGRQGAVIQAMSGVEIALWDIFGKAVKQAGVQAPRRRLPQEVSRLCLDPVRRHAGRDGEDRPRSREAGVSVPSSSAGARWGRARPATSPMCGPPGRGSARTPS